MHSKPNKLHHVRLKVSMVDMNRPTTTKTIETPARTRFSKSSGPLIPSASSIKSPIEADIAIVITDPKRTQNILKNISSRNFIVMHGLPVALSQQVRVVVRPNHDVA